MYDKWLSVNYILCFIQNFILLNFGMIRRPVSLFDVFMVFFLDYEEELLVIT